MANHKSLLEELCACKEARDWYDDQDSEVAWNTCQRGDWMLWIAAKILDKKLVVIAACGCAEQSLKYVEPSEPRPRAAIETAIDWANGKASLTEIRNAADAADAAVDAVAAVAYAAAYAAYAAAYAAYAAAYAADAAAYAADAVAYAADADTADAVADTADARKKSLAKSADIVRSVISWAVVAKAVLEQGNESPKV